MGAFTPKIGHLQILDTSNTSLTIHALVNLTNPTEYSAVVPYVDIHILTNGTLLGHATAKSLSVGPGVNVNIPVTAIWDPLSMGGEEARAVGIEFLSQYISGESTCRGLRRDHDETDKSTQDTTQLSRSVRMRALSLLSRDWGEPWSPFRLNSLHPDSAKLLKTEMTEMTMIRALTSLKMPP